MIIHEVQMVYGRRKTSYCLVSRFEDREKRRRGKEKESVFRPAGAAGKITGFANEGNRQEC